MASFGESSPPGGSLHFGTQHIRTDQWVRLASRFGRDLACFLDPSHRSCHWLRFLIRLTASSEGGALASFGESSPLGVSLHFGTQHIRTDQWVRLASRSGGDLTCFLDLSPRSCHWVRFVIRSSATTEGGELASFGESSPPGVSLHFGTQHIITGQWVRLGSRFGGDLTCFLDPSPRSCHWLRFVIRLTASSEGGELASFGESYPLGVSLHFGTQHIRTDQWVRLASRSGGGLARFLDPSPRSCHWLRLVIRLSASSEGGALASFGGTWPADAIGFVRGNGACGRALVVDRYELSKSGTREDSSFIIGRRRERVPGIR